MIAFDVDTRCDYCGASPGTVWVYRFNCGHTVCRSCTGLHERRCLLAVRVLKILW